MTRNRWHNVTYPAEGRAKALGVTDEGMVDHFVLEREDGGLEILEPEEVNKLKFENDFHRVEAKIPIEMLYAKKQGAQLYEEVEGEVPVKLVVDRMGESVVAIEFEEMVSYAELEDSGIVEPREQE